MKFKSIPLWLLLLISTGCIQDFDQTISVTYLAPDATSGEVPADENLYSWYSEITLLPPKNLKKSGVDFLGWRLSGSDLKNYNPGESFKIRDRLKKGTSEIYIFPSWKDQTNNFFDSSDPFKEYTVTFHFSENGPTETIKSGSGANLWNDLPKRTEENLKIGAWAKDPNHKTFWNVYKDSLYTDTHLYAHWIPTDAHFETEIQHPGSLGSYLGSEQTVTVPSDYHGIPVRKFDYSKIPNQPSIKTLILSEGIEELFFSDWYSTKKPEQLESVWLPNSLKNLQSRTFKDHSNLTSLRLPESLTELSEGLFQYCTSLTSIPLPTRISLIRENAFYRCTSLSSITFPKSLKRILEEGMAHCRSLTEISLPEGFVYLGPKAFYGCTDLENITLPSSLKVIRENSFSGCESLTSVDLSHTEAALGPGLFSNGKKTIPGSDYDLADASCSSLKEVKMPPTLKKIPDSTFSDCTALTSITLPGALKTVGDKAFENCTALTRIQVPAEAVAAYKAHPDWTALVDKITAIE